MNKKKRIRSKLGDVHQIPLPDGTYAYERLFKEGTLTIYKERSEDANTLPQKEEYSFFVAVETWVLKDGEFPRVENRPFLSEDDAWPPPRFIRDSLNGKYSLCYKREKTPSTKEECRGLEAVATWSRNMWLIF